MSDEKKEHKVTAYVEHPCSKEEKKSYRKKGFDRVVDIRFAPEKLEKSDKKFPKPKESSKKDEK